MAALLFEIESIIKLISDLESRRDLVIGNDAKSKLLIDRCAEFHIILENLEKKLSIDTSFENCLSKLKHVIMESLELVDNFCQPGWLRFVINISNANRLNDQFEELNALLSECRSDLHFGLDVVTKIKAEDREARSLDDRKLLNKIYEMLAINNIATDFKSMVSPRNSFSDGSEVLCKTVEQLQRDIPDFNHIVAETELIMDTIYTVDDFDENEVTFFDASPMEPLLKSPISAEKFIDDTSISKLNVDSSSSSGSANLTKTVSKKSVLNHVIRMAKILREQLRDATDDSLPWAPKPEDILGKGSFGIVYKGIYASQDVAIKVIQGYGAGIPPQEMKKIEKEVFILAKCHHPNIIDFRGCDMNEGLLLTGLAVTNLFAMNYKMYRDENGRPVIPTADMKFQWLRDIASGIQYLHFFDIIHRDLKPHNILLCLASGGSGKNSGIRFIAKITDFGVSSVAGLSSTMRSTVTANAVGTTAYKAPELFNRKIQLKLRYSKAIDIYAFGVMANELFSGFIPWADCNSEDIAFEVRDGGRPDLFKPSSEAEKALLRIIGNESEGCFAADKNLRPEAAALCTLLPIGSSSVTNIENLTHNSASSKNSDEKVVSPSNGKIQRSMSETVYTPSEVVRLAETVKSVGANPITSTSIRRTSSAPYERNSGRTTFIAPSKIKATASHIQTMVAASQGCQMDTIINLLNTTDIFIDTKDKEGMTPLMWMAYYGQVDDVRTLFERGADINAQDEEGSTTLLILSCRSTMEDPDMVAALLSLGASVDLKDKRGWTPLMKACWEGRCQVAELLIERGADIEANIVGKTPLMCAARGGFIECVRLLLERGAVVNKKDKNNQTALDYAVNENRNDVIELLKSHGAGVSGDSSPRDREISRGSNRRVNTFI